MDDVLLTGNSSELMTRLVDALSNTFSMKDMGEIHYFLGIQAQYHEGGLFLNQTKYAEEILFEAGMSDANPMPTPLPTSLFLPDSMMCSKILFCFPSQFISEVLQGNCSILP